MARLLASASAVGCVLGLACCGLAAVAQTDTTDDAMAPLAASPDPFAEVDMAAVLGRYGAEGSGVPFHAETRVGLKVSRDGLNKRGNGLVSEAAPIEGATSIVSDPTGFGFTVGLSGDYLFAFDKSDLSPAAEDALRAILALHAEYGGTRIDISGHTDAKGSNNYNQSLSERRAASVRDWFAANAIPTDTMTTVGYGETQPVADNTRGGEDYPEGRALNRRVDIAVTTERRVNSLPTLGGEVGLR